MLKPKIIIPILMGLAGLGSGIFGGPVSAVETACAAKGDACCRFEVGKQ